MRNFRYRQLSKEKSQPSETGHDIFSKNTSWFTIANFKPVGSLPIAKQKSITCMTGNAKMNNITLNNQQQKNYKKEIIKRKK